MRIFVALLFLVGCGLPAMAAPAVTVQEALKLLPKDQVKNLVRIEAREGNPAPERWYIQVYDPTGENGLREFVVTGNELTASRTLSQFLAGAKPEDVVGSKIVKVDSDDLIKLVQQYVEANHLTVAKINYTMDREAINPVPVWTLDCFDDSGKKLGVLVVNARNASVVSHDGFAAVPGQSPQAGPSASPGVPVRPAIAVGVASASPSPSPSPKKRALLQRMFGGNPTNQATPTPPRH